MIIGPAEMNGLDALPAFAVPAGGNLIASIHYYAPFEFTHQGAGWVPGAGRWLGRTWGGAADEDAVRGDPAKVASCGREHRLPVFIGEFGVFSAADMVSRARWTAFVRAEAERLGLSWAYGEFGTDFGAFDPDRGEWREPLRRALLGD
ncbi:glycoside hydrolase family 5 protein [Amycolatopsis sp. CA-126428]|uniref:glycoside hydrolase family 5 protein n=1 Tax=Amycolatopsis sp. CA-126428 TaxID=2073158 RepID=UPI000CD2C345|nr:cellulase family glycosylhydrolase [Amycolatopsis sp. CA-126428]